MRPSKYVEEENWRRNWSEMGKCSIKERAGGYEGGREGREKGWMMGGGILLLVGARF